MLMFPHKRNMKKIHNAGYVKHEGNFVFLVHQTSNIASITT